MIKFNRVRMNGDSFSEYDLSFCSRMTLQDFIEYVVSNKENRGVISFGVCDSGTYKSGSIQFVDGELVNKEKFEKIDFGILSMPCVEGTASGGWGIMNYRVRLTSDYSYTPTEKSKKMSENRVESIKRHEKVCREINRVYEKKARDGDDSFHKMFLEWGLLMVPILLGDKYNSLCALSKDSDQRVSNEAIRDVLIELANFAIMTIIELDKEEEK